VGLLCPLLSHNRCSLDQHLNCWNQNPFSVAMICRIICGILLLSSTLPQLVWCWRWVNHSCLALKGITQDRTKAGSKLEWYPYIVLAIDTCILAPLTSQEFWKIDGLSLYMCRVKSISTHAEALSTAIGIEASTRLTKLGRVW
jgi:hypothetical protein